MSSYKDEQFMGLPNPKADVRDELWDTQPFNKKYTKNWPGSVDNEMYQLLQELTHHPALPFQGNMSVLSRHAYAALINSLRDQLGPEFSTMWTRLRGQQRMLTNERYALHIDEILDKQVEFLREWTLGGEWSAVAADLALASEQIDQYPNPWWRRRAAQGWLRHKGVKALMETWQTRGKEEAPDTWQVIRDTFDHWAET